MPKKYIRYAIKNKIYHADDKDLGIRNKKSNSHDVIVVSVNKRNKTCKVKTITSLETKNNKKRAFKNSKLKDVRIGKITVIPRTELNTKVLSGVNNSILTIKTNKLYYSKSNLVFPRRYKHIINSKKKWGSHAPLPSVV